MGRTTPSIGAPPPSQRKDARAKRAKQTINKDIPTLLQAYPRARKGIEASDLIVDPPAALTGDKHKQANGDSHTDYNENVPETSATNHRSKASRGGPTSLNQPLSIHLRVSDTIDAAAELHQESRLRNAKSSRIGILNMASPLRPGGGFLNGATSQEESLCMRTTLHPALKEEFYRLPEVGAIYTHDVLVFRNSDADAADLPKSERFFVDVITAAMHRMPEIEEDEEGGKSYANDKDRETAEQKMRAVMRIAKSKGVKSIVLGAWGCGAYGNPVSEIAAAWRRVLLGRGQDSPKAKRKHILSGIESWDGMEVVFAIKETRVAELFAKAFGDGLTTGVASTETTNEEEEGEEDGTSEGELRDKIAELESQIAATRSGVLKDRLQSILERLRISD